jgi:hypothetical protein
MTAISSAVGLEAAHRPQAPLQPPMIGCWRTARCGAGRPKPTASPRRGGDRGGAGETAYGGSVGEPARVIAKLVEHPGAAPPLSDDRDHLKFLPRPARTEAAALSSSNQRETRLYPKFYRGHYELAPDINPHRSPQAVDTTAPNRAHHATTHSATAQQRNSATAQQRNSATAQQRNSATAPLRVVSAVTDYSSCVRHPRLRRSRPHHDTGGQSGRDGNFAMTSVHTTFPDQVDTLGSAGPGCSVRLGLKPSNGFARGALDGAW